MAIQKIDDLTASPKVTSCASRWKTNRSRSSSATIVTKKKIQSQLSTTMSPPGMLVESVAAKIGTGSHGRPVASDLGFTMRKTSTREGGVT